MKIVVISDSHGNIVNLKHVMGFTQKINAGAVIHCGDWTNAKAVETVLEYGIPLYSVLGNGDISDEMKAKFKEFLELNIEGIKIGVVHRPRDIEKHFSDKKMDIIFYGHIHSQNENIINGVKVIRPGALENKVEFAIYDTKTNKVEFVNE